MIGHKVSASVLERPREPHRRSGSERRLRRLSTGHRVQVCSYSSVISHFTGRVGRGTNARRKLNLPGMKRVDNRRREEDLEDKEQGSFLKKPMLAGCRRHSPQKTPCASAVEIPCLHSCRIGLGFLLNHWQHPSHEFHIISSLLG